LLDNPPQIMPVFPVGENDETSEPIRFVQREIRPKLDSADPA
jgi:hypothetical protein